MENTWVPLVDYRRYNVPEVTIHGAIAWVAGRQLIHSYGGNVLCFGRSMMKPVQIKTVAEELQDELCWESKAVSLASHNAEPIHIKAVKQMLKTSEYGLMQTPHTLPMMQFGKQMRRPRRWYHPCSGKHAAILTACKKKGWPRVGYTLPQHPFHQAYLKRMKIILGQDWKPKVTAKDGCGLPTISMTVNELAATFADLALAAGDDWIWDAMVKYPDHIGGYNRLDSTILKSCEGKVLAKEGADGLLGLSVQHPHYPNGLGIVIKIAHGWDSQAMWYVARWALGVLGFQIRNPYPLERQKAFIFEEIIPEELRENMKDIEAWDSWDPHQDRWNFDPNKYAENWNEKNI